MGGADAVEIYSLGGCGGFGMNATLYISEGEGLLVDFGLGLPKSPALGVNQIVPDPTPLLARCPRLKAVLLTHAHDDHVGALAFLPPAWRSAPIYGPGLSIDAANDRFADAEVPAPARQTVPVGVRLDLGRFAATLIHVTHSVPETRVVALDTPAGTIVHLSDFKLDPTPVQGPSTDLEALAVLGRRGVRLVLFDSTGALREGRTASERSVVAPLEAVIRECRGQVVVSTFASHLHRIQSLCGIAVRTGRQPVPMGLRMTRTLRHGINRRLFDAPAGLVRDRDALPQIREHQRLIVAGGCQGERDSSLNRISLDNEPRVTLGRGDLVVISASVIPGCEVNVGRMTDRFLRRGVFVVHAAELRELHVSGHGGRDEVREVLQLLRPEAVVPIHGDRTHLEAAARLAEQLDPAPRQVEVIERGDLLRLGPDGLSRGERIELPPRYLDETGSPIPGEVLKARFRMSETGAATVFAAIRRGPGGAVEAEVRIAALGVPGWDDPGSGRVRALEREAHEAILRLGVRPGNGSRVKDAIASLVGHALRAGSRRKPMVTVVFDDDGGEA
ncbi:MAG: ribonuclease J [Acidobacteria bacterium]|nr:ribonuclease J [Acidobacteriota bacterium]